VAAENYYKLEMPSFAGAGVEGHAARPIVGDKGWQALRGSPCAAYPSASGQRRTESRAETNAGSPHNISAVAVCLTA